MKINLLYSLREPQLNTAKARVEAASAAVEQAELDLQRTTIRAPFNAHILTRNVNVGSQVSPGQNLGRLIGRDTYWVVTTVPLSKLSWLSFPGDSETTGSKVMIRNNSAWSEGVYREGYLYKLIGALEDQTRMANILVTIPDPLAYRTDSTDVPKLMIGTFVETRIKADKISDVIRLNRDYIRKDTTVWVMKDSMLFIREVDIVFRDAHYAYIGSGLNDDDKIVTSNLSTVTDSVKLRVNEIATTQPQGESQ